MENFCSKEVLDFPEQLKCRSLRSKNNSKILLEELTRQQLINTEKEPSYKKLPNLLSFNSANEAERDSLLFLKRYI